MVRHKLDGIGSVRAGFEGVDEVFEFVDTDAVDAVDKDAAASRQVGIDGVGKNGGEDDRFGASLFGIFLASVVEFVVEVRVGRFRPAPSECAQIIEAERREDEAAIYEVAGQSVLVSGCAVGVIDLHWQRNLLALGATPDFERDAVAGLYRVESERGRKAVSLK